MSKLIYTNQSPTSKTHYCPGCGHGIVHKLIAQIIDELGIREDTLLVAPLAVQFLPHNYIDVDGLESAHGRAPAISTDLKEYTR